MTRLRSAVVVLASVVAVLAALVFIGRLTRADLDRRGHYTLTVADLPVAAPPGMTRSIFLAEVIYQGRLSATLDRTDADTRTRLSNAFAAHPWVESVVVDDLAKPQPITLTFRTPTLVAHSRVVDRMGVCLPLLTKTDDLPVYRSGAKVHDCPSGAPHPDPAVVAIAKTVAWLKAQAPALRWQSIEMTADGMVLTRSDGVKATWGFSKPPEPNAEEKLQRLKAWQAGNLDLRAK